MSDPTPAGPWTRTRPDASGLITAVVQDWGSGTVLMLAHQNQEAFQRTLDTGLVWFWSRSRGRLWRKGETSGHELRLKAAPRLDCDGDAVLYLVDPTGPVCHTGERTCFHRPVEAGPHLSQRPPAEVPEALAEIIARRRENASSGSYTAALLAAGLDRIGKKLVEEAVEVVLAAKNGDHPNLVWELADLYYHTAVLMAASRVTRQEVLLELRRRMKDET